MTTHQQARDCLLVAWAKKMPNRPQTLAALQALGGVADHESHYGDSWAGALVGSHNVGAIQCHQLPDANGHCPPGCAPTTDSHSDGRKYLGCFRKYGSLQEGIDDFVAWFATKQDTLDFADMGDTYNFCLAMRKHCYFEARGPTDEARARYYEGPVQKCAEEIAAALGEPVCLAYDGQQWSAV